MKKLLFAFLVLICANASALQINTASTIPADVSWGAFIELGTNFDEAKVYLDGSEIAGVYVCGSDLCNSYFDETKVFVAQESGNNLTLLLGGISEGNHELEARLFDNGDEIDSSSVDVTAIVPLEESYKTETEKTLNSLHAGINALSQQFNGMQAEIDTLRSEVEQDSAGRQQMLNQLNDLSSRVGSVQSSIAELGSQLEEGISSLNTRMDEQAAEVEAFTSTGFISFGNFGPEMPAIVLGLIIAALVVFVAYKNKEKIGEKIREFSQKQKSLYGEKAGKAEAASKDKTIVGTVLEESQQPENKGKWAFKEK